MADRDDPSAVRWLVGVELARFRERAHKTITAAAAAIGCSAGKVAHMEAGRNYQQPAEVTGLMRFYGADRSDIDRLASLAGSAGEQTWWAPWTDVVPDWLRTFVGLEGIAERASWYSPLVLPALLQTEAYALGVTTGHSRVRPDHNERVVRLRMERRRRVFDDAYPLHLTAILEEVVLDRPIGNAAERDQQLDHLATVAERDNVELLVLPTAVGPHDGLVGPFTLLDFAAARSVAYVELVNGAVYVQDQDQVSGYARILGTLRDVALSREGSVDMIRSKVGSRR